MIASQHDTIEKQLKKLESLQQQVARLLRRQYGPQKEQIDPNQLMLFTVEELEQLVAELEQSTEDSVSTDDGSGETEDDSPKPKRKGHGRRPIPDHIPRKPVIPGPRCCIWFLPAFHAPLVQAGAPIAAGP